MKSTAMKPITFSLLLLLITMSSFAQPSKNRTAYSKQDFIPELTTYDRQLFNLNFNSMLYWYDTAMQIESAGYKYFIVRSLDDFLKAINKSTTNE